MEQMAKMETERQHALLSASSSKRWLECTPSARLESGYPDEGSDFAREGSLAHALAAKKLKERLGLPTVSEIEEIKGLAAYLTGEMEEYTSDYSDFVMGRYDEAVRETPEGKVKPEIRIEQRLDYSLWVPEGFGTGDAVIVKNGAVEIIDFKYGKGVKVDAEHNTQMLLYALGAIDYYDYSYPFDRIVVTIYQPRVGNVSTWETNAADVLRWAQEVLSPTAQMAWRGLGARKSGEWCRFCRAKGDCPRLTADSMVDYFMHPNAEVLSLQEMGRLLGMLDGVKTWMEAIKERSLELALGGTEIPGYKVVEGRSVRKITDPRALLIQLSMHGYDAETLLRPRELKTLTELEQTVGKRKFRELCGDLIEKPAGKPTLVPTGDRREDIREKSDFDDLEF